LIGFAGYCAAADAATAANESVARMRAILMKSPPFSCTRIIEWVSLWRQLWKSES
jgi:hypothetical protein